MPSPRKQGAFSLVELLVVFVIIGVVLSVIAPSIDAVLKQQRALDELRIFRQIIRSTSIRAFSLDTKVVMELSGNDIKVKQKNLRVPGNSSNTGNVEDVEQEGTFFVKSFEYISFEKASLLFLETGYLEGGAIRYRYGNSFQELEATGILNVQPFTQ